ncbi:MAG: phospholipase D family protein [Xanthomonadales bacterium]|nr:Cardiolipin synthase C [Xanthomonadales bacterium]MCC6592379.1 phospholipase D family protein [Xanthomonadales bacterium]
MPIRVALAALLLTALSACTPLQLEHPLPPEAALAPATTGTIAQTVAAIGLAPGESSYRLIESNTDALALQLRAAQLATRSLDSMYYMWLDDVSGRLLACELMRAADRGVRVRVLVDDMYARKLPIELAALDRHPRIELRVYHPYRTRNSAVGAVLEFVFSGFRLNHRMHNKAWIADGQIALLGGRNVGDPYFGLHEGFDFRDLGVLLAGAGAREVSAIFDEYWNSPIVLPLAAVPSRQAVPELADAQRRLEEGRARTLAMPEFAPILAPRALDAEIRSGERRFLGRDVHVASDLPDKWQQRAAAPIGVAAELRRVIDGAQREVVLISPYFVPGREGIAWLRLLEDRGVQVRVLTNSVNATDIPAVHGGYARYRRRLLRAGIEIHELKRSSRLRRLESPFHGSSRASLHTKAVVIDGRIAFVGSFNLDPRSTWINTEMGVFIDDPRFAAQVRRGYERSLGGEHSYRLALEGEHRERLVWYDLQDGQPRRQTREPTSSWSRRLVALLARVVPTVERHL